MRINIFETIEFNQTRWTWTQMSTNRCTNKQSVVYTYNALLFSLKMERNPITYYHIDEPWGCYAKWNKWVTKRQIAVWFHFYCFYCSVAKLCLTLRDLMDCSMSGFPVLHHLLEFAQTRVHLVNDAIQSSHLLSSPSPPALNLSQHQGLFEWVGSLHQVANVLELQLQHQSFQWIFWVDVL